MASKKIKYLTKPERDLILHVESNTPGTIKRIEAGETFGYKDFRSQLSEQQTQQILSSIGKLGKKETYQAFIKETADESGLTKEELQTRLEAFQGLKESIGGADYGLDAYKQSLKTVLINQLQGQGLYGYASGVSNSNIIEEIGNKLSQGNIDSEQIKRLISNAAAINKTPQPGRGADVQAVADRVFNEFKKGGEVYSKFLGVDEDVTGGIKRLEDTLRVLGEKEVATGKVEDFLTSAPEEARTRREEFIRRQTEQGRDFLTEEAAPSIVRGLNVISPQLVRGGQVAGLLGVESAAVAQKIQSLAQELEEEDFNFFANATYQNTIRKLAESTADATSNLDFQRTKQRQEQENVFTSTQNKLTRDLSVDLFRRQQERNLKAQQTRIDFLKKQQSEQERLALIQSGAQAGAQVGSGFIFSKLG